MTFFRSIQRGYTQPIALVGVAFALAALTLAVLVDREDSMKAWPLLVAAYAVVVFLLFMPLTITVTDRAVKVRLLWLFRRNIALEQIAHAEINAYHPLRQFGGWGWRFGSDRSRQYAMKGSTAVILTLDDGREVYLGAPDLEGLRDAIDLARAGARR